MMLCDAMFRIKPIPWVLTCVYVALWLLYLASDSDWKLLVLYYPLYPLSRLILLSDEPLDGSARRQPAIALRIHSMELFVARVWGRMVFLFGNRDKMVGRTAPTTKERCRLQSITRSLHSTPGRLSVGVLDVIGPGASEFLR